MECCREHADSLQKVPFERVSSSFGPTPPTAPLDRRRKSDEDQALERLWSVCVSHRMLEIVKNIPDVSLELYRRHENIEVISHTHTHTPARERRDRETRAEHTQTQAREVQSCEGGRACHCDR